MNGLYALKSMMIDELEELGNRKEIPPAMLDRVDKLAHATKNLCKVIDGMEGSASYYDGSYRSMGGYSRDNSYARGRGQNARRDSMGRYSGAKEDAAKKLEKLMESAPDEKFRQRIQEIMDSLDNE